MRTLSGYLNFAELKMFEETGFDAFITTEEAAAALGIRRKTLLIRARRDKSYLAPQLRGRPCRGCKNGSLFGVGKAAVEAELAKHGKGYLRPPFGEYWNGGVPKRNLAAAERLRAEQLAEADALTEEVKP